MKKRLTILTLFIALCYCAFAQNHWIVDNPHQYNYNASITGIVNIDGEQVTDTEIEIAAFCGDVVRGSTKIDYANIHYKYYACMQIYGKSGDELTFKLYDHKTGKELSCISQNTITYEPNRIYGNINTPFVIDFYTDNIAKVGENKYKTLAEALESVENPETDVVTILKDATGPGLVINKDVTIDFNGKTYSFNEGVGSGSIASNGFQILQGNDVTLKNGTLNVNADDASKFYILVQNYANLTVDGMTLDGTNLDKYSTTDGDSYTLSNNSGTVNISNSTIKANNDGNKAFAFDACKYANYEAPVVTLDATSTINGKVELNGGQLFTNNDKLNVVAKKEFIGGQSYWSTISTPIKDATIPTDVKHDLYRFDEIEQQWEYYYNYTGTNASNPYTTLELGRGYLYVAGSNNVTVELNGTLNVNNVQFTLSYTEGNALAGFNMVGNPFSHNITDANWSAENATLSSGFYVISENGGWLAKTTGSTIAPMESVLVKSNAAATLTINKTATSKRSATDNGTIAINVSNENYSDVAYVSFNEGIGLDKINHRNNNVPMVYIPVEGVNYAIAMMSQDVTEIPVSFKAATMGEYTISVEAQNCEYTMMTLVDRLTGIETNLLIEDYSFIATSKDNADRFFIRLDNSQQTTDNSHFAYINNGMINVDVEGQGVVSIYDITGRPVAEYNVATSANIATSNFAAGVYVIRMSDENGIKVQKIVIE